MQIPQIKHTQLFDVTTVTRCEIVDLIRRWGSDNGGTCIIGLLMQVAELKGFEPITVVDLYPDRTHCWKVASLSTQPLVSPGETFKKLDGVQSEYLGPYATNKGVKYFVLEWVGKRPDPSDVHKKLKQHGVQL